MTEYTLWGDNPTPDITNNSDGGAAGVTLATGCLFGSGGAVLAVRFRATTTVNAGETYTIAIFDYVSGALIASKSVSGATITGGAWNRVDFDSPVTVDNTHAYVVAVWQSAGRYVAKLSYFVAHSEGSLSNVYAWGDSENISSVVAGVTAARNGQSKVNSALSLPNNFTGHSYYVAPVWDDNPPSGGDTFPVTLDATAVASATSLSVHAVRRVTLNPVSVVSGTSLRFTGSAYVRRGGSSVPVPGLAGAVRRDGVAYAFGS